MKTTDIRVPEKSMCEVKGLNGDIIIVNHTGMAIDFIVYDGTRIIELKAAGEL